MLKLVDAGEGDHKIIAIPPEADEQVIKVEKWKDFEDDFFAARQILELWFTNYDPGDTTELQGWGDEQEAGTGDEE